MKKKKLEDLTEEDMNMIIEYPKSMGKHKGKEVTLLLGPYGIYMKYDKNNYKIDQSQEHSYTSLIDYIR